MNTHKHKTAYLIDAVKQQFVNLLWNWLEIFWMSRFY